MNTRLLMISSAIFLGAFGLVLSFAPHEVLQFFGAVIAQPVPVFLQLAGASLIGWALVNWFARGLIIGGIYARPLTLGNLVHFTAGALGLAKLIADGGSHPGLVFLCVGYSVFCLCFGFLAFGKPRLG